MLLNWAVEVLAKGSMMERENMAMLVCMLLRSPTAKETLLTSNDCFFLHNIHKAAHATINSSLKRLLNCIICTTKDQVQLGVTTSKHFVTRLLANLCIKRSYVYT